MQDKLQQITDRIKNKTFLINAEQHRINDVALNGTAVYISTDKRMFVKSKEEYPTFVKSFLPVDNAVVVSRKELDTKSIQNVRDLLINNLNKLSKDENYIKQANAVNSTVNTLMNTFKTEISLRKAMVE